MKIELRRIYGDMGLIGLHIDGEYIEMWEGMVIEV